jgi:hypothetical protein
MAKPKPFYKFVGRQPNPPYTDRLIWQNRADPTDRITASEWWFWRLWRYYQGPQSARGLPDFDYQGYQH